MNVSTHEIERSITPLRCVFWGSLLCVLDITFSETSPSGGWRFDILNDFVGMLLIVWGVMRLATFDVHGRYGKAMRFVTVVAVLSCVDAFQAHFIYAKSSMLAFLLSLLGVAAMVATVVFCVAMRWLSEEADLPRAAGSWRKTTILFVVIYLIPLGLFYAAAAIAVATDSSFNINLGPAGLLLVPVFFIPIIHLFISTSRMMSDAEALAEASAYDDAREDDYSPPTDETDEGWMG